MAETKMERSHLVDGEPNDSDVMGRVYLQCYQALGECALVDGRPAPPSPGPPLHVRVRKLVEELADAKREAKVAEEFHLKTFARVVEDAQREAKAAHVEVGRHAGFLLKLHAALVNPNGSPADLRDLLESVVVMHGGFPTVDGSKL